MSRHDDSVCIKDMLAHASEAMDLLSDRSREALCRDRVIQLALTRLVEIVGEAANRVSADGRRRHPEVPWPKIIGMRNRLIHGYDVIDYDLLYNTIRTDLPPLIQQLRAIVGERR